MCKSFIWKLLRYLNESMITDGRRNNVQGAGIIMQLQAEFKA